MRPAVAPAWPAASHIPAPPRGKSGRVRVGGSFELKGTDNLSAIRAFSFHESGSPL